jgi:membrane-associated phospholipid phosphatase
MGMKLSASTLKAAARLGLLLAGMVLLAGCADRRVACSDEALVRDAAQAYVARCSAAVAADERCTNAPPAASTSNSTAWPITLAPKGAWRTAGADAVSATIAVPPVFTLGSFDLGQAPELDTNWPTASGPCVPEGYWRQDIWHQMGHEALEFGKHGFWRGFEVSYWKLENALVLTAAMGASITIRETGVDDAIARRTKGEYELGDMDETIQILGNPGTHFAGAGVLWLTSALMKDAREHEVAKSLVDALAVNGVSTILLKVAANTSSPDGDRYAWPSGHTSSSFCAAAVLNEYYGPWVGIPSLALAGLVGYQRIDSRVHDFSDVVFGGFLGYVIGASIAKDNKVELPELFGMKVLPFADPETGASGLALLKQW